MEKGIILYRSKYGATQKYANWLKDATGFDCVENKKVDIALVTQYHTIVLAGGIYASGIAGLSFLRKNVGLLSGKKIAVLAVGASPFDENAFAQLREHNLKDGLKDIPCFYGRGSWNEDTMSFGDKTLCKMLQKAVAKQDPATYEPWQKALMCSVGQSCDWTDKKYLEPLLDWIYD